MLYRALASVFTLAALVQPAAAVTITFETLPDGTPIQDLGGPNCGEITNESFSSWGVIFTTPDSDELNIATTLDECLSGPNALWRCTQNGIINITFVVPNTSTPTVVDGIDLALLTGTTLPWVGQIRLFDAHEELLDSWNLTSAGFCREPPFYYDSYHYSAPGLIARAECFLRYVGIDNLIITEVSTPVQGTTWGSIKSTFD